MAPRSPTPEDPPRHLEWSSESGSNWRPFAYKANALSTELSEQFQITYILYYTKICYRCFDFFAVLGNSIAFVCTSLLLKDLVALRRVYFTLHRAWNGNAFSASTSRTTERLRFELRNPCGLSVFKTDGFSHSPIFPKNKRSLLRVELNTYIIRHYHHLTFLCYLYTKRPQVNSSTWTRTKNFPSKGERDTVSPSRSKISTWQDSNLRSRQPKCRGITIYPTRR